MVWVEASPQPSLKGKGENTEADSPPKESTHVELPPLSGRAGERLESFVGSTFGRINKYEATLTISELKRYLTKIGKQRILDEQIDTGVISPYRAQVQYLRHLIKKDEFFKPYRKLISVNTVDGFQGQERDIILISLVRSNEEGQIGFLRDLRRMNVAITRARMKVIILGDPATLCRHPFYKQLYDYIQDINH
jgi:superfamily I DNA and/or RNA helicase